MTDLLAARVSYVFLPYEVLYSSCFCPTSKIGACIPQIFPRIEIQPRKSVSLVCTQDTSLSSNLHVSSTLLTFYGGSWGRPSPVKSAYCIIPWFRQQKLPRASQSNPATTVHHPRKPVTRSCRVELASPATRHARTTDQLLLDGLNREA